MIKKKKKVGRTRKPNSFALSSYFDEKKARKEI